VLVVANVTATSPELLAALRARGVGAGAAFTVIVPATGGGRAAARTRLQETLDYLRAGGLEVRGAVGDGDPVCAVSDAWDPTRYDEIVISTLPMRLSKWLHAGLPERVAKLTGAPVTHVVSQPPKPGSATVRSPSAEKGAGLGPLSVLAWGGHRER